MPLAELFLQSWQAGRFSHQVACQPHGWVFASDVSGVRLALRTVRLFTTEPSLVALRPLAQRLAADPRLAQPGRRYVLSFPAPQVVSRLVGQYPEAVRQAIADWAAEALPPLLGREQPYRLAVEIPLPAGRVPRVLVEVSASARTEDQAPLAVRTTLPDDPDRLFPALSRVLAAQLPKLSAADERVLLLALPVASWKVLAALRVLAVRFPLLAQLQPVVVDMRSEKPVFSVANPARDGWTEVLEPVVSAVPELPAPAGALASLTTQARTFAEAAKARHTVRAYQADWNDFRSWCEERHLACLPAEPTTVALYLTDRAATHKTSSLARRLTTISRAHQAAGLASPASMQHAIVSEVWKGIQRKKGTAEAGKKPLLTADLQQILRQLPDDLQGKRDRALLLVGFAGGFRRSELAALTVDQLEQTAEGIVIRLTRSKTDQEGQGRPVALPHGSKAGTCPVKALRTWLEAAAITTGAVFRGIDQFGVVSESALHSDSIGWIVKRAAGRGGLEAMEYAGHSLRAGLATQAAMNGASELAIMKQTGHRSLSTVRKYIREGTLFRDNAATKLGL